MTKCSLPPLRPRTAPDACSAEVHDRVCATQLIDPGSHDLGVPAHCSESSGRGGAPREDDGVMAKPDELGAERAADEPRAARKDDSHRSFHAA